MLAPAVASPLVTDSDSVHAPAVSAAGAGQTLLPALYDDPETHFSLGITIPNVIQNTSPAGCTGDPLPSDAAKQAVAPLLYAGGLTPTLNIPAPAAGHRASQPRFTMTGADTGHSIGRDERDRFNSLLWHGWSGRSRSLCRVGR